MIYKLRFLLPAFFFRKLSKFLFFQKRKKFGISMSFVEILKHVILLAVHATEKEIIFLHSVV